MGKHSQPETGNGWTSKTKVHKSQVTQVTSTGTALPKQTSRLWGIFSGKKGK